MSEQGKYLIGSGMVLLLGMVVIAGIVFCFGSMQIYGLIQNNGLYVVNGQKNQVCFANTAITQNCDISYVFEYDEKVETIEIILNNPNNTNLAFILNFQDREGKFSFSKDETFFISFEAEDGNVKSEKSYNPVSVSVDNYYLGAVQFNENYFTNDRIVLKLEDPYINDNDNLNVLVVTIGDLQIRYLLGQEN